jgi:hypothetical protein
MIGDVRYLNTGDWVESCTALIEDFSGEIRLVRHADLQRAPMLATRDGVTIDLADGIMPKPMKPRVA